MRVGRMVMEGSYSNPRAANSAPGGGCRGSAGILGWPMVYVKVLLPALATFLLALGSAPPWNESRIDATQAGQIYGTRLNALSPGEARALLLSLVNGERRAAG